MSIKKLSSTLIVILLIIASIFSFSLVRDYLLGYRVKRVLDETILNSSGLEKDILNFIRKRFLDSRGLVASEIRNDELGKYSLLESMGQLMEYALTTENPSLFETTWKLTKRYFLSPRGYLCWRINRKTLVKDDATSLLDSLRIANALIKAYEVFKEEKYLKDGIYIGENIIRFNSYDKYLIDYFDGRVGKANRSVSLFYLNLEILSKISQYIPRFRVFYESSKKILEGALKDSNIFFPIHYDIASSTYHIPSIVNMIEQIYIAINISDYNLIKLFVDFVSTELKEEGRVYASYLWNGKEATRDESFGVYASLSILFLNLKDREILDILLDKIGEFKLEDYGFGDHKNRNFYIFDQLEVLTFLAKRKESMI